MNIAQTALQNIGISTRSPGGPFTGPPIKATIPMNPASRLGKRAAVNGPPAARQERQEVKQKRLKLFGQQSQIRSKQEGNIRALLSLKNSVRHLMRCRSISLTTG